MKKKILKSYSVLLLLMFAMFFSACSDKTMSTKSVASKNIVSNGKLNVHYLDVGQADSILITQDGHSMLIDAGNNADGSLVVSYLKKMGVRNLDYVIGTHPHEDHIGGLDNVINAFNVKKVFMPKKTSTTRTYKGVIKAIKNKGLKITLPKRGYTFKLGNSNCTIVAPIEGKNYKDTNNYSIVIKLTYKNTSFLFTGDAENISENEILRGKYNIKADVLKVGHHGSHSSTTKTFLRKVDPKYAIISCGKNNDYGHPHESTINRLKRKGISVYRTDKLGTIIATSDGNNISFDVKNN